VNNSPVNRQQLCVALGVCESTVRRWEALGLPFTPIGKRHKRYEVAECKTWLKENSQCLSGPTSKDGGTLASWSTAREYIESSLKTRRRVMPSN
jgi:hypothetical protein